MTVTRILLAVGLAGTLAGCVDPAAMKAKMVEETKQHCASEGKQYIERSMSEEGIPNITTYKVQLMASCVGLGEPGYVAPAPSGQQAKPTP